MKCCAIIDFPDDFEKGECNKCPFSYWNEDLEDTCVFNPTYGECPIDIEFDLRIIDLSKGVNSCS